MRSFLRVAGAEAGGAASTYFDPKEVGFAELEEIYDLVTTRLGQRAVIVDAGDLLARPAETLEAWCAAVGLPFDARMTSWEASEPTAWDKWPGWHNDAAASTGFKPTRHADAQAALPEEARKAVEQCQPIYDRLFAMRLRA